MKAQKSPECVALKQVGKSPLKHRRCKETEGSASAKIHFRLKCILPK